MPENLDHSFYQYYREGGWTYAGSSGATDRDKRVDLTSALKRSRILACPEHVKKSLALRTAGVVADNASSFALSDGEVLLNAHYDGTSRTGQILTNEPVCFDYTTGKTVTGVNSGWLTDEYVVVGTALDKLTAVGTKKIPVRLQPPADKKVLFQYARGSCGVQMPAAVTGGQPFVYDMKFDNVTTNYGESYGVDHFDCTDAFHLNDDERTVEILKSMPFLFFDMTFRVYSFMTGTPDIGLYTGGFAHSRDIRIVRNVGDSGGAGHNWGPQSAFYLRKHNETVPSYSYPGEIGASRRYVVRNVEEGEVFWFQCNRVTQFGAPTGTSKTPFNETVHLEFTITEYAPDIITQTIFTGGSRFEAIT